MAEMVFWFSLLLIVYAYFIYPLLLFLLNIFFKNPVNKKDITPSVSLIITAYNEEKCIREKIEGTLNLDYPKDKLEIIVASDCSTDNTDKIVREYEDIGIRLVRQQIRKGKTAAQNNAVESAKGEILVFSDATTIYRDDAINKLVRSYNDLEVGCVAGEVIYTNEADSAVGDGGALYWKYESKIKQLESNLGSILGAAGCIYSMRRALYFPMNESYLSDFLSPLEMAIRSLDDDFLAPLRAYFKGVRSVMEPEAISYEKTSKSLGEEFKMRSRVITRAISGLVHMKVILNPFVFPTYSFQIFSHKILKWLIPVFMMIVFISNLLLFENLFYYITFQLQMLFYIFAILGFVMDKVKLPRVNVFFIPYYFCIANLAVLAGVCKFVVGKRDKLWTPER